MVAATLDNATHVRSLHIDGSLVASDSGVANHSADTDGFSIGDSLVFTVRKFNGLIDEVSVLERALDANEISTIYNSRSMSSVPEPSSLAIFGIGGLLAIRRRRLKK